MAISDALVRVFCDKCNCETEVTLTSIAGHCWDERNVDAELKRDGWIINSGLYVCESCNEDGDDQEQS